jgi:hypothetical protein
MAGRDEEARAQEIAAREELARLREEHRDFDNAIEALERLGTGDRLQVQRLKKRKLGIKDRIAFLEDQLTPDIIA